jgi:hypothetical protein
MATTRTKIIDKNRFSKRYPLIRSPVRTTFISTNEVSLEIGSVYFDNVSSGTFTFDVPFSDIDFRVVASPRDIGVGTANVNLSISELTRSHVVIQSSGVFTGYVDIIAIRIV